MFLEVHKVLQGSGIVSLLLLSWTKVVICILTPFTLFLLSQKTYPGLKTTLLLIFISAAPFCKRRLITENEFEKVLLSLDPKTKTATKLIDVLKPLTLWINLSNRSQQVKVGPSGSYSLCIIRCTPRITSQLFSISINDPKSVLWSYNFYIHTEQKYKCHTFVFAPIFN